MSNKKLILIDGYGFLFRAYYAIQKLTKRDGTPTGAVYGFTKMLRNILLYMHSTHLAVVFDTGKKNFRHELYPEYKANRPPAPVDLIPQFPVVREAAEALSLAVIEKVGYEADDVIATLTRRAEEEGFEVVICSSDKDLMQLVSENVTMYDGMKRKKIGINEVKEKWGVEPEQVLDLLSLTGDSSDNVPGVPGIGPKTAADLINKYKTLEEVLSNAEEIRKIKLKESLIANSDKAILSKKLITLDKNVILNFDLDVLSLKALDPIKFIKFLKGQEFYSIVKEVEAEFGLKNLPVEEKNEPKVEDKKNKECYHFKIRDLKELDSFIEDVEKNKILFFDIQTQKDEYESEILSLACSVGDEKIYYVDIKQLAQEVGEDLFAVKQDVKKEEDSFAIQEVLKKLQCVLENSSVLKIGYNVKKLFKILKLSEVELNNFEDVSVISYILDAGSYKQVLSSILSENLIKKSVNFEWCLPLQYKQMSIEAKTEIISKNEAGKELESLTENIFELGCFKIEAIQALYKVLKPRLKEEEMEEVYEGFERYLIKVLANMEFEGIALDVYTLNNLSNEFSKKINELEKEIHAIAGVEFNVGSPKQLGEVLFDKLQIPTKKKSKKTGAYSTNFDVLEKLSVNGFEIASKILDWRHYSKLRSTYTDALPEQISKRTGRVHTHFSNVTVATGRLSSSDPNLQNIPIRDEHGEKIRSAFVAKKGCKLIAADYSQVELRVLADYANVESLIDAFQNNRDIHAMTAAQIFCIPEDQVTKDMRRKAKIINFSIVYGTTAYGLAKRLEVGYNEAQEYIDSYFAQYPEIKNYMEQSKQFAKENGFVKTLFGRKCYVDLASGGFMKSFLERLAINAPIQGTAADIIKKAMINLDNEIEARGLKSKVLLQVHDELVLEVLENEVDEVEKLVRDKMENVVKLKVPLRVDIGVGDNWQQIH